MRRLNLSAVLAYAPLIAVSLLGAWLHWRCFAAWTNGYAHICEGCALPVALELVRDYGSGLIYFLPIALAMCAISSAYFEWMRKAWVVGLIGALMCFGYLSYAFALSTPLLMHAVGGLF